MSCIERPSSTREESMRTTLRRSAAVLIFCACSLALSAQQPPDTRGPVFNVRDYGAVPGSSTPVSQAINKAIVAANRAGGGTVFVPAGHYTSGPIEMASNITLYFDAGAIVTFPAQMLPFTPGRQQGIETLTPVPLIGGHDLENVAVTGRGVLMSSNADWMKLHSRRQATAHDIGSANGPHWEQLLHDLQARKPISQQEYREVAAELRPSFIRFMNSKNILVSGLRIIGSPMWTVHLLYSENATVENMVIETYPGVHTDGIVVDSSRFVRLTNDYIDTGDDGIVIKAGKDADGLRVNRPSEDIAINNCTVHHAHGAVTIGSETSGSVRNVVASNITVLDAENGARIKSERGRGGVVEDIRFDNWTMENIHEAAIVVTNYYTMEGETHTAGEQPVSKTTPVFRNIAISHMTIHGAKEIIQVEGLPEMPIRNLRISDVIGTGQTGMTGTHTDGLELRDINLDPQTGPAFSIDRSSNLELDNVTSNKPLLAEPVIRLDTSPGAVIRNCRAFPGTGVFLSAGKDQLSHTILLANALTNAKTPTE